MRRVSTATNDDATLRIPTRFGLGFMVSMDNRHLPNADSVLLGEHGFGHVGAGGSIGFADPVVGLAVGYAMNQQGAGILMNDRGQSLIDAAYACAGAPLDA
jgi:CubicO group peptidase (beta-lactamase class C family)